MRNFSFLKKTIQQIIFKTTYTNQLIEFKYLRPTIYFQQV